MKNEQELHVRNIIGPTEDGKAVEVFCETDTFELLNETFVAKKFNKDNKGVAGVKRMESPLQFNTGVSSSGIPTYKFPFANAVLYVQFIKTLNEDGSPKMVLNEKDGKEYPETLRKTLMTATEAESIVAPVVIEI